MIVPLVEARSLPELADVLSRDRINYRKLDLCKLVLRSPVYGIIETQGRLGFVSKSTDPDRREPGPEKITLPVVGLNLGNSPVQDACFIRFTQGGVNLEVLGSDGKVIYPRRDMPPFVIDLVLG